MRDVNAEMAHTAVGLAAAPAFAQRPLDAPAALPAHAIVRAWRVDPYATPRSTTGNLVTLTSDSVVIHSSRLGRAVRIPTDSVARLEFSTGRKDRGRNGLFGAAVGAAVLATTAFIVSHHIPWPCDKGEINCSHRADHIVMATVFGAGGALAGAAVGVIFPGPRVWQPIPLP